MPDVRERLKGAILFVTYGGGHAAALAPVAKALLDSGQRVEILALTTARAYFQTRGFATIGTADLLPLVPGYADAGSIGDKLCAGQSPHHAVSAEETRSYLGIGYKALEAELGAVEAERQYALTGRQAFLPKDFFKKLFAKVRPQMVVATSAPRSERAALEEASHAGIPALCLVDLYAPFEIEWCAAPGFADRICVLNDVVAQRFIDHGAPVDSVVVTGNPAFDRLADLQFADSRRRHRNRLGLGDRDKLIVWISQPEPTRHPFSGIEGDPNLPLNIERELAAEFAHDERIHLVMRLHPSEDRPPEVFGSRIRYGYKDEPLDDLLASADCLVTTSSTVGLEAALIGVPVIQLTNSIFSPDLPLAELKVATAASNASDAMPTIRAILEDQPLSSGGSRPAVLFDATTRVSQQINQLLNERAFSR